MQFFKNLSLLDYMPMGSLKALQILAWIGAELDQVFLCRKYANKRRLEWIKVHFITVNWDSHQSQEYFLNFFKLQVQ